MANDGRTTPSSANDVDRDPGTPLASLDDMRRELERAADDLERVTQQLYHRTGLIERFEVLVDELLDLLTVPVVLVDENARVIGLSRGAAAVIEVDDPSIVVGKQVSSVLPSPLSKEVADYVRSAGEGGRADVGGEGGGREAGGEGAGGDGKAVRFLALPGGSTLVVLDA